MHWNYCEVRKECNGFKKGWWVYDGEGAACHVESKEEAKFLAEKLNSIDLNGRCGDFSKICDRYLEDFKMIKRLLKHVRNFPIGRRTARDRK